MSVLGLALAAPAIAQANSPWENAVNVLQQAFTSTIARGLSLVAIVVSGLTFAFARSKPTSAIRSKCWCMWNEGRVSASYRKSWSYGHTTPTPIFSTAPSFTRRSNAGETEQQQDIPLTEAEAKAGMDGVNAFEKLLTQLSDVPAPGGATARQLQNGLVEIQPTNEGRQ